MSKTKVKTRAKAAGERRPAHRLALPDQIARLENELVGWTNGTYAEAEATRVRHELLAKRRQMAARKVGSKETLASMLAVANAAQGEARAAAVAMVATLGLTEAEVLQLLDAETKTPEPEVEGETSTHAPSETEPEWMQSDAWSESDQLPFLDD